ncbi:anhydro-N-acetylmuramic acid kinase [Myroides pelagicus]|uniref:Anhydro-N-acetylmuramic acid kinase n=1 Tax=Myroides pelagicus TaxID=270914 RepID=A0A7K1GM93_9FLAO|nr:anhydro-N-acetylmuramic acid kinase [Myroides pelagicus]MEC4113102.1 anhydro-N-acetylmuramic acid kinase [Myroides pelagicus]MTH30005.1 anhydro-N-acetylmuramic acid kinase [Myroides pelagicus]
MKKYEYTIIGVMSGTSLDGVDLAYLTFNYEEGKQWAFRVIVAETVPYSSSWKERLISAKEMNQQDLEKLDERYTLYLSTVITKFIETHQIEQVDLVCSHGHTIFHKPDLGYTLQIGNLPILSDYVDCDVICDFRVQDVLLGGQGAPLVPIGDRLLFGEYFACLNLGGFANISFENKLNYRIAFDICPVNTLLNEAVRILDLPYDEGGKLASKGSVSQALFQELNSLEFFRQLPPKSLGVEYIQAYYIPILQRYTTLSIEDLLATYVEHIALQIANALPEAVGGTVLVTGGGAHNTYLMDRIRACRGDVEFIVPEQKIVDYKEAIIFGLLGVLKWRDEVNVLASVTGAKYDHSSGKIYKRYTEVE